MSAFCLHGISCSEASAYADPTALVASLLVSLRPIRPSSTASFGFSRPYCPRALVACQTSAHTTSACRQARLSPTPWPSWPHKCSAFVVYGTRCSTALAWVEPMAPVGSLLVRFGFGRTYGHCGLAAYPFGLNGPNFIKHLASADPTALVASLLVILRPIGPQILGNLGFGHPYGHRGPSACLPSV